MIDGLHIKGVWTYHTLSIPDHLDNIDTAKAVVNGEVIEGVSIISSGSEANLILRSFWLDLFSRFKGSPTVNQGLNIKYFALGSSYEANDFTQTTLNSENFRSTPDEYFDDGLTQFSTTLFLKKSEGNESAYLDDTPIVSATLSSITVPKPSGSPTYDNSVIEITTSSAVYTAVVSGHTDTGTEIVLNLKDILGGNLITESPTFDPADIPQAGDLSASLIGEAGLFIGDDATSIINTGRAMNRKRIKILKNNKTSILLNCIISGGSID